MLTGVARCFATSFAAICWANILIPEATYRGFPVDSRFWNFPLDDTSSISMESILFCQPFRNFQACVASGPIQGVWYYQSSLEMVGTIVMAFVVFDECNETLNMNPHRSHPIYGCPCGLITLITAISSFRRQVRQMSNRHCRSPVGSCSVTTD
jgi:hypothetical protein